MGTCDGGGCGRDEDTSGSDSTRGIVGVWMWVRFLIHILIATSNRKNSGVSLSVFRSS